jgi:hypothetical protein
MSIDMRSVAPSGDAAGLGTAGILTGLVAAKSEFPALGRRAPWSGGSCSLPVSTELGRPDASGSVFFSGRTTGGGGFSVTGLESTKYVVVADVVSPFARSATNCASSIPIAVHFSKIALVGTNFFLFNFEIAASDLAA